MFNEVNLAGHSLVGVHIRMLHEACPSVLYIYIVRLFLYEIITYVNRIIAMYRHMEATVQ
jgi:hypothetical protein